MPTGFFIEQQRTALAAWQRVADSLCIVLSLYLSQWLVHQPMSDRTLIAALAATLVFMAAGELSGTYHPHRSQNANRELLSVIVAWAVTLAA
ncbi:MAG: hypothetical protein ACTHK7_15080, partial [Aureliella sp.]